MANHKSALKKIRQDQMRYERNKGYKTRLRNVVKNVEAAVTEGDKEHAEQALKEAVPIIDRVASKGVIHKNTAARKKSRLAKYVNTMGANQ